MNQLNQFILEGNLVKDPEYRQNAAGKDVSRFTLASKRIYKNAAGETVEEVSYFDMEARGSLAKQLDGKKAGRKMRVVGSVKQTCGIDKYGGNCSKIVFEAERIEFKPQSIQKSKDDDFGMGR